MNDQNGHDSIRMSRRGLLRMGAAGLVGGSLLAREQTGFGQASGQPGPNTEAADVPRPRTPQYRFRVGATTLNPDGRRATPGITIKRAVPRPGDSRARGLDAAHRSGEHAPRGADVDPLARPVAA